MEVLVTGHLYNFSQLLACMTEQHLKSKYKWNCFTWNWWSSERKCKPLCLIYSFHVDNMKCDVFIYLKSRVLTLSNTILDDCGRTYGCLWSMHIYFKEVPDTKAHCFFEENLTSKLHQGGILEASWLCWMILSTIYFIRSYIYFFIVIWMGL